MTRRDDVAVAENLDAVIILGDRVDRGVEDYARAQLPRHPVRHLLRPLMKAALLRPGQDVDERTPAACRMAVEEGVQEGHLVRLGREDSGALDPQPGARGGNRDVRRDPALECLRVPFSSARGSPGRLQGHVARQDVERRERRENGRAHRRVSCRDGACVHDAYVLGGVRRAREENRRPLVVRGKCGHTKGNG